MSPASRACCLDALVFTVLWLPYAWLVRRFWFVTDDAYITFRYARNLARGFGPRYNLGETPPVEGYSSFLWMIACAIFELFELSVEWWPLVLSFACGTLLLWLVFRILRRRFGAARWTAALATLLLALHPPFAVYSTSGLETLPFVLLLFVCVERLILRRGGIEPVPAGLALLGLSLIRVEGIYWGLVLVALAALSRRMLGEPWTKPLLAALAILVLGYGSYWLARFSYYGFPFANVVYVKTGLSGPSLWRGVEYVVSQLLTQLNLWVLLPAAFFGLRRGRAPLGIPLLALALGFHAYAILVSGDFMAMGRFLLPAWVLTVPLVAWMLEDLSGSAARRAGALALVAGTALLGLLPAFDRHPVPEAVRARFNVRYDRTPGRYVSEYRQWEIQKEEVWRYGVKGRALRRWLQPSDRVVTSGIGAVGYYSDRFLYDQHGLVNHEVATADYRAYWAARGRGGLRMPGHDKLVPPSFFFHHDPEVIHVEVDDASSESKRSRLADRLVGLQAALRERALSDRYVVDFRPIPEWEYGGPHQYLVMWRRIPRGRSPQEEASAFQRRVGQFRDGIDEYRAIMAEGYPRPPSDGRAEASRPDPPRRGGPS